MFPLKLQSWKLKQNFKQFLIWDQMLASLDLSLSLPLSLCIYIHIKCSMYIIWDQMLASLNLYIWHNTTCSWTSCLFSCSTMKIPIPWNLPNCTCPLDFFATTSDVNLLQALRLWSHYSHHDYRGDIVKTPKQLAFGVGATPWHSPWTVIEQWIHSEDRTM